MRILFNYSGYLEGDIELLNKNISEEEFKEKWINELYSVDTFSNIEGKRFIYDEALNKIGFLKEVDAVIHETYDYAVKVD